MSTPELQKLFLSLKTTAEEEFKELNLKYNTIAVVRIALFIVVIIAGVWFANLRMPEAIGITVMVFFIVFGLVVRYHNKIAGKRDKARFIRDINQQEIASLDHDFSGLDEGNQYIDKAHPYLYDLDIFGRNSLFIHLNRCATPSGTDILAGWLTQAADKAQIIARQEAVEELKPMVDWRQNFQAAGMRKNEEKLNPEQLLQWINEPNKINGSIYKVLSYLLPLISLGLLFSYFTYSLPFYTVLVSLGINGLVLKRFMDYVKDITDRTSLNVKLLHSYEQLIIFIETTEFKSEKLKILKSVFHHENFSASLSIRSLQQILDYLNSRANMFYLILNTVFMMDLHLVLRAEAWKRKNKADMSRWFQHIGEFEALCSIAGFAFAHDDYVNPTILSEGCAIRATKLGHPLIKENERIANNVEITNKGSIAIITGSNMSGKSTFLRTIGVNTVLAFCGAPVCALSLDISLFRLFTGMRTEDNLEEHVSSFYAELKRIRFLLDEVDREGRPVMFMLDEILKGTNSKDRHKGAAALVKQLSKENAFGFISTHDLELGQLAEQLPYAINYSFNSTVENDKIIFDYKLTEGICKSFNASKLMEKMGIKME